MFQSIIDDIKGQFSYGNMITKIILVNLFVFIAVIVLKIFNVPGSNFFENTFQYLTLSSEGIEILKRPWTLFTHMVTHEGLWHLAWNMLILYWFGRIVGDLSGDKRVLPLYIIGGLGGALLYFIYVSFTGVYSQAHGASAAVMAFVVAAGWLAPEYNMRLILFGDVKLKYIVAVLLLIDLVMIAENQNTGGRMAHIGGALTGLFFVEMLRRGVDITEPLQRLIYREDRPQPRAKMKVVHNKKRPSSTQSKKVKREERPASVQDRIDAILDKINATGYDSLTAEEKDFLYEASQK